MTSLHATRTGDFVSRMSICLRTDGRLLVRAIAWRLVLPVLKHAVPLRTLARWMSATPPLVSERSAMARRARVDAIRELLAQGGRLVISGNCLERSLLLYRFLGEAGAAPRLVMGVNREGTTLGGHAWVELDGEPLADATTGRFVPVMVFSADGTAQPLVNQCAGA